MHRLGANNYLMPFKSKKCSLTTIRHSLHNNNINRNVGSSHLCFYTCMTTIGQSEKVLESINQYRFIGEYTNIPLLTQPHRGMIQTTCPIGIRFLTTVRPIHGLIYCSNQVTTLSCFGPWHHPLPEAKAEGSVGCRCY